MIGNAACARSLRALRLSVAARRWLAAISDRDRMARVPGGIRIGAPGTYSDTALIGVVNHKRPARSAPAQASSGPTGRTSLGHPDENAPQPCGHGAFAAFTPIA